MKAIIRQNSPIASDKANPRIQQEKSDCFSDGFLAYPTTNAPNTFPIPAPEKNIKLKYYLNIMYINGIAHISQLNTIYEEKRISSYFLHNFNRCKRVGACLF